MGKFGFAIDRGGTFTDVYVRKPDGSSRVLKLLSEDPMNYSDAPTEAIRRVLEEELNQPMPRGTPVKTEHIEWIRMGTTVATNALLERKGERTALAVTKGFSDLLHIGNQTRPRIFDLKIEMPEMLYEDVVEVDERVVLQRKDCCLNSGKPVLDATTGDKLEVWQRIDRQKLEIDLKKVLAEGIRSLAVVLFHSYMFRDHEIEVGKLAKSLGFANVSLSSQIMPMIKIVPRGFTACADAYLTPKIEKYIAGFSGGFEKNLQGVKVLFMQSDGGLCPVHTFFGSRAILSGPAGGVVGVSLTAYDAESKTPVIGFDMGGTSTDVSRYAGDLHHVFETTTDGVTIQAPQLDIHTVAAGGGSRLFFRDGLFVVGPESAGANPGPICYKKGGYLSITDANLVLGRILPQFFPKIFGENEDEPLDREASLKTMSEITKNVNDFMHAQHCGDAEFQPMSVEEVALGFINVANETMCRPIRALTQAKGFDTSQHLLACFGGAGGQHACAITKSLGMKRVYIHRYAGVLSAYGLALADVVYEAQEPSHSVYKKENFGHFDDRLNALNEKVKRQLKGQGFLDDQIVTEVYFHMRYDRTDCALMCSAGQYANSHDDVTECSAHGDFLKSFVDSYMREFGFTIPGRDIVVDNLRVRGIGKSMLAERRTIDKAVSRFDPPGILETNCYFKEGGHLKTKVFQLDHLWAGHVIVGPAIIIDVNSTILVEPGSKASITDEGDVQIDIEKAWVSKIGTALEAIQLSIFSHRFMSIAEQMGRMLERTSISTNIKERLDFSCALFGPDGGLVANAPHMPVHLGAMQETVRYQMSHWGLSQLKDGDVLLCNHPAAGGSHLPDLTVITPVYYQGSEYPVFFVANRAHHAEIGGLVPGSMPPQAVRLEQEGAMFLNFKLVDGLEKEFKEKEVIEQFMAPAKVEGCSGTRNLNDNLSDLRAQVASNQKGIQLICELIDSYGLDVVQAYVGHIQANAELAVREMLRDVARKTKEREGSTKLEAQDFLDDGSEIKLVVELNSEKGEAVFDFTGTGMEVYASWNAPRAVTKAATIYCMRCLVGRDIPLNQGCMAPIQVVCPDGTLLTPSPDSAVVGGNVETSSRIVDVILKAFRACAASQGTMNNTVMGDESYGYYETVSGGAGAGPGWNGRSGIHTHMTNARITDAEILERRYPIILKQFCLRKGTGGAGKWKGGDGVIRELLFRKKLRLSLLGERRVFAPYGMEGGYPGTKAQNILFVAPKNGRPGRSCCLGGKTSIDVDPWDVYRVCTPGGGGYGKPE